MIPLVSVFMITYNHEKYIAQAIESVLVQRKTFPVKVFIGEDCSTDNTKEICLKYKNMYPDKIELFLNKKNLGLILNEKQIFEACVKSGAKYIAMLEGDDYWIDPLKLQKQVDFLEANPEYGFIRTGGYDYIQKKNKFIITNALSNLEGYVFNIAKNYTIARTSSVCFRKELLDKIDFDEFRRRNFLIADLPMWAIFSKYTLFGYLPDLCIVYRVLEGSESSPKNCDKLIKYNKGYMNVKRYLHELFPDEVDFDEIAANDYIAYTKLRCAYKKWNYREAKNIAASILDKNTKKKKLVVFATNKVVFYLAAIVKYFLDKIKS